MWSTLCLWAATALAQPAPSSPALQPFIPDDQGLAVRVQPIADGLSRSRQWTALRVTLLNVGDSTEATLSYTQTSDNPDEAPVAYHRVVELTKGTRKEVVLPIQPGNGFGPRLVSLETSDGRSRRQAYTLSSVSDNDVTVGVIGDDALGINGIGSTWGGPVPGRTMRATSMQRQVLVGLIPTTAIPDRSIALQSLDFLVWPKADPTKLNAEQLEAVTAWVADGGHLVVTLSDNAPLVQNSGLAALLPVELHGTVTATNADPLLTRLGGVAAGDVPTVTADITLRDTDHVSLFGTLVDGRPAWVVGEYGLGTVSVLAVDPMVSPVAGNVDKVEIWRRLLWLPPIGASPTWYRGPGVSDPGYDAVSWMTPDYINPGVYAWSLPETWLPLLQSTPYITSPLPLWLVSAFDLTTTAAMSPYTIDLDSEYGASRGYETSLRGQLNDIPGVAPLPLPWLLAFATLYLFAIGPFDYFVLRALGRQPWTWVTFPIYIVVFSALALVGTQLKKGSQAAVVRIELVDILPGGERMRGESWLGIFATRKTELTLRAGFEDAIVTPLPRQSGSMWEPRVVADEGPGSLQWRAETWTLGYARTLWNAPATGKVTVVPTADLRGVKVSNGLTVDLLKARLFVGALEYELGDIPAGKTVDFPDLYTHGLPVAAASYGYYSYTETGVDMRTADSQALIEWAETSQLARPAFERGLFEPQYAQPTLLAISTAPIEPLQLTGLEPDLRNVTVVRVALDANVAKAFANDTMSGGTYTGKAYAVGSVIRIRDVSPNDYTNYQNRKDLEGQTCVVTTTPLTTYDSRWYTGYTTCADGQSIYWAAVRFDVVLEPPPIPETPVYPMGTVFTITAIDPIDPNAYTANTLLTQTCTAAGDIRPSSASGDFSGSANCPNAMYTYFERWQIAIVSVPKIFADQQVVRITEIDPSDTMYAPMLPTLQQQHCVMSGASFPNFDDPTWQSGSMYCNNSYYYFVKARFEAKESPADLSHSAVTPISAYDIPNINDLSTQTCTAGALTYNAATDTWSGTLFCNEVSYLSSAWKLAAAPPAEEPVP